MRQWKRQGIEVFKSIGLLEALLTLNSRTLLANKEIWNCRALKH